MTNENDNAPAFTSPATVRVAENQVAAYEAAAADADGGPLSYSLSGTDAALFTIDANTGAVSFRAAPDFEAPGDADGDNVYDIIVTASDDTNSTEQPVAITVTNENDNAPAFTSPATVRVAENQVAAYEAAAADAEGDPLSYSLSGTDAALFTIDANTGAVSFRAAPDFEAPGDADGDNVYDIIVTASDDTNSTEQPVAITVTNENDNPPAFTSPATVRVAENQVAAYEAAAADADGGPLSYSLSGTDAALFTIDANTGAVSFRAAPDFEAPGDADRDNVYDIIVTASDGANSTEQPVAITVTNENDNPPAFTSPATVRVAENQVAAYEAAAADADGDPPRYSLSGTDAALFTIDANTGAVSFRAAPDFEAPGDADGDNVYDIIVTASDDTNSTEQPVAITVTNENDNVPAFTSPATARVAENQVAAYEAAAADADGDPLSYSLSGTDAALFTIDANTGAVSFRAAPDFEAPGDADGDNVYDIIVTASDDTNSTEQPVAITVTNENDNAPAFTSPATVRVAENQVAAYEAAAADAEGDPLSYSLSGTDAALFTIDANTGAVSFRAAPDFEAPGDAGGDNVYDIIVTASDDTNSTEQPVAITVTNENDNPPAFTSPATARVAENQVAAYEAAAADADGDPLSYSLSGTDAALFTIDANTGVVSFRAAPDFEAPGDADGDNVYDIIVTASDDTNSTEQPVAITVTNEYEPIPLSSLDGSNGFILNGIDALDDSGRSVSSAGDVNGDGYDDLIIGASGADPNGDIGAGETYVVYGGANAPGTGGKLDLSSLDGTNGFILNGIDALDYSGWSVSSAGDVNGDGYDDLIIGTNSADPNGTTRAGETYVIYGGANAPGTGGKLDLSSLDGTNGFILNGIDANDQSGRSVSSAGDVNGDGYDDLIIGADGADPNGDDTVGETYVVYGGASAPGTGGELDLSSLDGTNGFILNGIDEYDYSGWSVSSAGDVNGDGYNDLIIGAREADPNGDDEGGETYVVYGGASAPGTGGRFNLSALDGTNGFILNGIDANDQSGRSVSSAGDVNGDGYDDLIIGADGADPNGDSSAGETYVVYGGPSAPGTGGELDLSRLAMDGNGFILTGVDAGDRSGFSVSSAGDVNGDGYDDLIIGARYADPNGDSNAGETYIVYGGASAPSTNGVLDLSALDGTNGFILTGVDAGDNAGWSVSSAGDVNGDGYDDLIIGAREADPNDGSSAGETYVVYGGATGTESLVPVTAQGTAAVDNFSGNAGADSFTGIATDDVVRGGAGDDNTSVTALDFAAVDGGTGRDTLKLDGSGLSLDLTGAGHASVDSVEIFDLSGTGSNTLVLDAQAVFDVTEERAGGVARLDVLGDADDRVDLGGSNFALTGTVTEDGTAFAVYSDGNAQVRVENGVQVQVQIPPVVFTSPATVSVAENQLAAYEAAAVDAEGDPLSYSLSGTDAALFTIDANTGVVSFKAAPDFEAPGDAGGDNVYDIIVTASDDTNSTEQPVAITVTNENDNPPVFTSPATVRVAENQVAAYEAAAADADGDPPRYSLSGTDAALFTIDANTGAVSFRAAPDFEAPGDDDGDNVYDIIVTASDGANSTNQNVAITVTNENDNPPAFTSPATVRVAENQVAAYEAAAADAEGDPLSYSLSGTDAALFTIDADTGVVSFKTAPDFEAPGDAGGDNVYDIIVTASDDTNSTEQPVAITVTNENDNPPVFTSPATARVAENQVAAYEAAAADADGDPLSYSLSGTDAALFTIDANTGVVSFKTAPDFEAPGDAGGDNVYDIIVTASDDTNSTEQPVAITVTNENDNPPVFTSPATARVAENQVAAYEAAAADAEGDPLSYSLSGTDAALFTIDANTGVVSFKTAPDFEAPGDAGGDNVYDIIVTASDDTNSTEQPVAITVTNENDNPPVFTSPATARVAENQVAAYEAAAADADGDPLSYSLSGTDAALFTIDANTGAVSFRAAPDFEAPGDAGGDNVYDIIVTASDGANSTEQPVAITVTNEYEPIPLSSLDGSNGFILNGIDALDDSGRSVSSAGDVNGDGYDDLIIGASGADPNGDIGAGETYVVYGGANAPGTGGKLDLSSLDGTNGFILNGIDALDYSGWSVSSAGDVNGDGYDDLIIGTNSADPNGTTRAGETYVIYGGANAPGTGGKLDLSSLDGTNGFILNGIDANDQSGRSVSSAGDVNGDGYDDLIIGADGADPNGDDTVGETYVVYGGASAPGTGGELDLSDLDGTNGFILNGIDEYDYSGWSVSSAGDVNGDGYNDLIIGAREADPNGDDEGGETYVVYGGASAPGTGGRFNLSALDGTNGFILNGIDANDQSGRSVSSAGDVNGDGYDDLIIGADGADPNGDSSAGETYVVYGGPSAPGTGGELDLSRLAMDGNGFILTGVDAGDRSGFSVSSAGDVNGDGYDDLIIGARYADPNGDSNAGETYIVYGGASAPSTNGVLDLSALDGTNGFILTGVDAGDNAGWSVSSAGDVNGDGYDDLIIGAREADPNDGSSAGETYVVYGGATGTESLVPVTAQGTAAVDNFSGNAGADSFTGIATDDVVRGGAGDDNTSVTALDFAAVDGGTGRDTLKLDGSGLSLDLTGAGHASVDSVEIFDLSGTGSNTLVLDAQAVFDVTEERAGGVARLDVLGDADDRVDLGGSNFALTGTVTEDGTAFAVYSDGNAQVRVENGVQVQVQIPPVVFTSPATVSVAENQVAAYEAAAVDAEGDPLSYSLSGTDAALFTIDANTGVVSFKAAPDFEAPGDAGGDNVYDIIVTASDGANSTKAPKMSPSR